MTPEEILEYVSENNPEAIMFRNPDFISAIVGWIENEDGLPILCYDYNKMVESLAEEYEAETDNPYKDEAIAAGNYDSVIYAIEFIDYNTIRALAYQNKRNAPIILYN